MVANDKQSDKIQNERLIRRYWEECRNQANFDIIDELFAEDHIGHGFGGSESWRGRDGVREFIEMDHTAFPDAHYDIQDIIATEDRTVTRWVFRGNHDGPLHLYDTTIEATGNEVAIPGVVIDRIEDGKIAETWVTINSLKAMQQLDVVNKHHLE